MAREGVLSGCRGVRRPLCFSPAALAFLSPSRETHAEEWLEGGAGLLPASPGPPTWTAPGMTVGETRGGLAPICPWWYLLAPAIRKKTRCSYELEHLRGGRTRKGMLQGLCESSLTVKAVEAVCRPQRGHRAVRKHRGGVRRGGFKICQESCRPNSLVFCVLLVYLGGGRTDTVCSSWGLQGLSVRPGPHVAFCGLSCGRGGRGRC